MFFDFLKKRSGIVNVKIEGEKGKVEKKHTGLIVVIIAAIAVLVFWDVGDVETNVDAGKKNDFEVMSEFDDDEAEGKLEKMISTIKGAGKVNVMVVFETKGEKIPAMNKISQKEVEKQTEKTIEKTSGEENVILFGKGSDENIYVLKEKIPVPAGVFITATGAQDDNVRLEIYEAVKALYGISGHRIKVSPAAR